jgi:hypothetical protein
VGRDLAACRAAACLGTLMRQRSQLPCSQPRGRRASACPAAGPECHPGLAAARRFAQQQEELVALREECAALSDQLQGRGGAGTAAAQAAAERAEAEARELRLQLRACEEQLAEAQAEAAKAGAAQQQWQLQQVAHQGALYLLDRASGRLYTQPAAGHAPRPAGKRAVHTRGRCDLRCPALPCRALGLRCGGALH